MEPQVYRFEQMPEAIGLERSAIYDRLSRKSPRYDPSFPKPFKIGPKARAVAFDAAEVKAWREAQMKARDAVSR